ncbi:MAG: site-2 protease family protein, partial [Nitriliruptoraceae bacterium]
MTSVVSIIVFIAAIVAAIMLHELGHFVTARRFGMRADRFFLGFGPTLVSRRIGETEYGVKALPLGGFVRIVGMSPEDHRQPGVLDTIADHDFGDPVTVAAAIDRELSVRGIDPSTRAHVSRRIEAGLARGGDPDAARALLREVLTTELENTERVGDPYHRVMHGDADRFFHDRPAWQRAIVLVSGSLAHFLIAIGLLIGAYVTLPQWTGDFSTIVAAIEPGSPADAAGLRTGDRVLAVDDVTSSDYETLRAAIRERPGEP